METFENFKNFFITFIEEALSKKKSPENDILKKMIAKDYFNSNQYLILDFNYSSRYSSKCLSIHGVTSDNNGIVFGANLDFDEEKKHERDVKYDKELYTLLDKKIQKMILSTKQISNDFNLTNIRQIYCFGFGFSENDEYFIHSLLHYNPEVKFFIMKLSETTEKDFSFEQLISLHRTIRNYYHDLTLIDKKIFCNDIKVLQCPSVSINLTE